MRGRHHSARRLEEARAHPDAARIALVDEDGRCARVRRTRLGIGAEVPHVTHQEKARHLRDDVRQPLQAALHRRPGKLARDLDRYLQPERGRVQLLLRQADGARSDVLVGVEADLLEDGG